MEPLHDIHLSDSLYSYDNLINFYNNFDYKSIIEIFINFFYRYVFWYFNKI